MGMYRGELQVMDKDKRRRQLGRFLRERREHIGPQAVGLPMTRRRRTPGLRREEVATLAGISTTYYTKIEQGSVSVSDSVLGSITEVLQLSHTQRNYAFALATGRTTLQESQLTETVSPALKLLLELQEPFPAQVMGRRWDLLAWNQATCAALGDLDLMPPQARNLAVMMFTAPQMRQSIDKWEVHAKRILAEFRADYGKYHSDPAFGELIEYLTDNSPEFELWWRTYRDVGSSAEFDKVINHPTAGALNLVETALSVIEQPGLRVLLFLPKDEITKRKLQRLYDQRMARRTMSSTTAVDESPVMKPVSKEPEKDREALLESLS